MTYKANRPSLKRSDPDDWTAKLWDWIKSIFWLLFLICILGGLVYLAYQAIMTEINATKPGTKVGSVQK